ncbi:MAG TPA: class I SAM-dependent methyltransferase [Opitutaceae bacterium]|jgi:predicted O-methyltransferase YrrM|nr:class I SAM-dependent methyltransferase [Opitutaceae bacterium]
MSHPDPANSFAKRLRANLAERLRVIHLACTRRYLYGDLAKILPPVEPEITDIRADLHPFAFARGFPDAQSAPPDFSTRLGSPAAFSPAGAPPWNTEPSVSAFLGELALHLRARTIVELGSFVGWTSAHFALALQQMGAGHVHCVESMPAYAEAASANLTRLGLAEWADFHVGLSTSTELIARLPAAWDLVFIDTSHQYEDTVREIALSSARLTPGGCIALHDSMRWGGVRRPILEAAANFHVLTFATELGNGLTVLRARQP